MTTSATIPVTVTPEAAARIAELGFHAEVERMIDYARQQLPDVERIELELNDRYDTGGEPGVWIAAYGRRPFDSTEHISRDLARWAVSSLPPEVLEHLHLAYYPGADHAG